MGFKFSLYDANSNVIIDGTAKYARILYVGGVAGNTDYTYNIPTAYQTKTLIYWATPFIYGGFNISPVYIAYLRSWEGHYAYKDGNTIKFTNDHVVWANSNFYSACHIAVID